MANSLNGNELLRLRAENEQLKKSPPQNPSNNQQPTLSAEEIRQKIADADKNPENINTQRNLGLALYRYGAIQKDPDLIAESTRLLQRVFDKNPKDYDVVVAMGHAFFDIGFYRRDGQSLQKGREFYLKALEQKPDDADVKTDLGISYYIAEPPDYEKAATGLQKALETDPKHERALLYMTQTMVKQNKTAEAEKFLGRLREVNPQTPSLAELTAQMSKEN